MYQFLETIKISNLLPCNLELHQKRVNRTFRKFYPNSTAHLLENIINTKELNFRDIYKCRILYNENSANVEYESYQIKPLNKLGLVKISKTDYSFKFSDRSFFDNLKLAHSDYDDLILTYNDRIMDSTYANLIFSDGSHWYTPDTYLQNGTKRQLLLSKNLISERKISIQDLNHFQSGQFINAMLDIGDQTFDMAKLSKIS